MVTARASDLPLLIVSAAGSPRSRIERGLESIGGMTAETLQRISTTVGGVVKSPVVLMAKVRNLASPRAPTLSAPPGSSLEERVFHLEIQMKSFEERFSSRTIVTELDLSPCSHEEKPQIAKSLLQDMEMEGTLVKRVQVLEDRVNERIERIEKALSSIQSQLDQVKFNRHESVVGYERAESLSREPQYYDAEQQSDNFEAQEVVKHNFFGVHGVFGEGIGGSPTLEKSRVKETSSAAPITTEQVEYLQEIDTRKNDDFLDPQVVSTPVYSKEAFLTQPLKSVAPSSEPAKPTHRDDVDNLPGSLDQQLASTLEELHRSFVTESLAAAASAKFLEIAQAVTAGKSTLAHASLELQSASIFKEPQEAFSKEPLATVLVAKSEEHAQEDVVEKSGTTIVVVESPLPPAFEATQKDFIKEPLAAASNANLAQDLASQGVVIIALASSEPLVTSKSVEEPLVVVSSANFEEPAQEDTSHKSVTMTTAKESSKAFAFQDLQEDFVKQSSRGALGAEPAHEPSLQEDSCATSDMALASSESPVASKFVEELSTTTPGSNFEEPAQEDAAIKSGSTIAVAELPLTSSLEEPHEEFVKEFMVVVPSVDFDEHAQENFVGKTGTKMAARELSLASSLEEPKEGFEKESMASAPSGELVQEHSDMVVESLETKGASKFVEEALATALSANFGERAHKADANKSGTIIAGAESPLASSFDDSQEDFEKESWAAAPSVKPIEELAAQDNTNVPLAAPQTTMKSKFVENPSTSIVSAGFEEPTREDANKGVTMTAVVDSPLASSYQDPQEDFEKESLVVAPSARPIHKPSLVEDVGATSDVALASFEPAKGSKFVEEPSSNIPSASSKELAHEDCAIKSDSVIASVKSPLASSFEESHEDFEKESVVVVPDTKPAYELELQEESDMAPFEPEVASKFVEEPLAAAPNDNFEEPAHKDADNKSVTMAATGEDPHEDFVKESLVAPLNARPTHELLLQEDLDATSDMTFASFAPHLASTFVEKPSPAVSSTNFEELGHDKDALKSSTLSASANSTLASSFEEPQEDFEKETLAATLSRGSAQGLAMEEDSHIVPISCESQEASKSMEEQSTTVSSADFEEPSHEDVVDKSVAMTAIGVLPFASSFEGPHEDFEVESIAAVLSTKPLLELATQEDSDTAPFELQVASKFVDEPLAIDVPSAKFEEPTHKDYIDRSGTVTVAVESPLVSSLEEPHEDYMKESLVVGASEKVLEPREEDESGQEKNGIVLLGAESTLTSKVEEGNYAAKEVEYKLTEDFKVHDEHINSIEKEFPRGQSNLAHVGSDKLKPESLVALNNDDRMESDESSEEFFDVEHGSGNFEPWESHEPKAFEEFGVGLDEATGINVVAQKETLVLASSVEPAQEPKQAPVRELAQELGEDHENGEQAPTQEPEQHPKQEPKQQHAQKHRQALGQMTEQELGQESTQGPPQELGHKLEQQLVQEPEQEDLTLNSTMALPPSEPQVTFGESQELLVEESLAAVPSTKFEEPAQVNANDESGTRDLPLASTAEESQIDTVVSPEKNLSSASFRQNGNLELLENLEYKSLDIPGTSSTPHEALEREPLIVAPTTKIVQGHDARKSDNVHTLLEPQLEESKEALANELVKAMPSSKSIEPAQEVGDRHSGAILASLETQLTPTLQKPQDGFVIDAKSTPISVDFEESLVDESLAVTLGAKVAQESVANKISVGLVEELPLTSIVEEPQNSNMSSLMDGKHVHDEADQKFLEDVKIIAEPIKEAIPRTQSDLTHVKLNSEAIEDTTKLQSQGSFLVLGATSVDSIEALVKESLPSTQLLELLEEENNLGKRVPVLANSPMTSAMEEPQKSLAEEPLASAKLVPKGHARWRGFARSSSEPQFAYKLEEHQKALVKESSVAAIPSTSKLGDGVTQRLPFRILGKSKHPRKELDLKLVEDVKSPATKSEITSSPYILEPKPSKIKEKKKKEKKEKNPNATTEEKERRLLLGLGEMGKKGSLRAEEKDSKYSPQGEEKHNQPLRHLRDRLRHAFSVNKEP